MNKLVAGLLAVTVALSVACGVLFYQVIDIQQQNRDLQETNGAFENSMQTYRNQIDELKTQINKLENQIEEKQNSEAEHAQQVSECQVEITGVSVNGGGVVWGMTAMSTVTVTIQNVGNNTVEDLTVSVRHISGTGQTEVAQIEHLDGGTGRSVKLNVKYLFDTTQHGYITSLRAKDKLLDTVDTREQ